MVSKLKYNKEYFFLAKEGEIGGAGFVKLIRPAGDNIHYRNCTKYEDLWLEHPFYKDEMDIIPYSEDIMEFRKWHHDNNISLAYSNKEWLKERLYEIKDINKFPLAVKLGSGHIAIGPAGKLFREWQLHLLIEG